MKLTDGFAGTRTASLFGKGPTGANIAVIPLYTQFVQAGITNHPVQMQGMICF